MKTNNKKVQATFFWLSSVLINIFVSNVQLHATEDAQPIIVQVQTEDNSSLEKQIEFGINNMLPGAFKGIIEGASLAAGVSNGFGKLPTSIEAHKQFNPLITEGLVSGLVDAIREDEEELCKRDEGYVPYLAEKGVENFSKYMTGLLLLSQVGPNDPAQRAHFLTQYLNSLCRGQEFTRGKVLKFLMTLGTRGLTEGLNVDSAKQISFSAQDSLCGVLGGLIPEVLVKFALGQKNTRGKVITRIASTATKMGLKVLLTKYGAQAYGAAVPNFQRDLFAIHDHLMNPKVLGGVSGAAAFVLILAKLGLRPKDLLDMVKLVKEVGPATRALAGF